MVEGGGGRGERPKVMGRDMMGNERRGGGLWRTLMITIRSLCWIMEFTRSQSMDVRRGIAWSEGKKGR